MKRVSIAIPACKLMVFLSMLHEVHGKNVCQNLNRWKEENIACGETHSDMLQLNLTWQLVFHDHK